MHLKSNGTGSMLFRVDGKLESTKGDLFASPTKMEIYSAVEISWEDVERLDFSFEEVGCFTKENSALPYTEGDKWELFNNLRELITELNLEDRPYPSIHMIYLTELPQKKGGDCFDPSRDEEPGGNR